MRTPPNLAVFNLKTLVIGCLACLFLISMGIATYAIVRIGTINTVTAAIPGEMNGAILLGSMNELAQEMRAVDGLAHNSHTDADRAIYLAANTEAREAFSAAWSQYAPGIGDEEERRLAHTLREAWQHFLAVESEAMALDRAGETALADEVFSKDFRTDIAAFHTAVTEVLTYRHKRAVDRAEAATNAGKSSIYRMLAVLGLAAFATLIIAFFIIRRVLLPIGAMTATMRRLAQEDLDVQIPGVGRGDEIGQMAAAVQTFKDNAIAARSATAERERERERRAAEDERLRRDAEARASQEAATVVVNSIGKGLSALALGDLTQRLQIELPPAYESLRVDLNKTMDTLSAVMREVTANASSMSATTEEIARAAEDMSQRTERQAASLEETVAALHEIVITVKRTSEGSVQARGVVDAVTVETENSDATVDQAVVAMEQIEKSSREVEKIISVIDEITLQTNLLALNAGVEAARAGDAGRGFAVVASEVRALAQRSAEAAKEIRGLISGSTTQVVKGVELVGKAGTALRSIRARVTEVNSIVAGISVNAQEQSTALEKVSSAIGQMNRVTQQNAAMVEESSSATRALATDAASLARMTARFKLKQEDSRGYADARPGVPRRLPTSYAQPTLVEE